MALSEKEIDRVVARLKKGDSIHMNVAGGRYIFDLVYADGAFSCEDFQEGTTFSSTYTEAEVRLKIAQLDEDRMRRFIDIGAAG